MVATNSLNGVFTGIDTDVLVRNTMLQARQPLTALQNTKSDWEAKTKALDAIRSSFATLQNLASNLSTPSKLRSVSASSSDDAVSVTASTGAAAGTHKIEIDRLASADREVHKGLASATTAIGEGNFIYTYGTTKRTIQTTDTTTLEGLRDLINDDGGNPGITASILEYDSGDGLKYHLVLSGNDTGVDNAITFDAATTVPGMASGGDNWLRTQTAQNAKVRVDDYPAGAWIERSSNAISDIIPGVTISLQATGSATVTISRNTKAVEDNLKAFVAQINSLNNTLKTYTGYDAQTKTGGIFQSDYTVTNLTQDIRSAITTMATGFKSGSDSFVMAADIGIEIDKEGVLSLDEDKLSEALTQDYNGVLSLISMAGSGISDSADIQYVNSLPATQAGSYKLRVTYDVGGAITSASFALSGSDTWRAALVDGTTITGSGSGPEQGLAVSVLTPSPGETVEYDIRLRQGFAAAAYSKISDKLDEVTGFFTVKSAQIDSAVTALDQRIEDMQTRLDNKEKMLKAQYARMETALAKLDQWRTSYEALFNVYNNSNSSGNN